MNKAELKELVKEVLSEEESNEPEIIQIARRIVKNQQFEKIKDPVAPVLPKSEYPGLRFCIR